MSRTLARRGASILLTAMALLGGGLALGAGTASAAESPAGSVEETATGSVDWYGSPIDWVAGAVFFAGTSSGSIDAQDIWTGCARSCPDPIPTYPQIVLAWLQGIPPSVAFPPVLNY
jgi:hypothetical protein